MNRLLTGFPFHSGHVHTLFAPLFRPEPRVLYERRRFETSDGDFVDLDWSVGGGKRLAVILHGLEGHSRRKYVLGMARAARIRGLDVLAMNFRGCGGEPNRKLFMYHSGWTRDLHEILLMVRETDRYESVVLVGFSLGANIVLKYLGEDPGRVPDLVRGVVALSVPCDLEDSSRALARPLCRIYTRYLLGQLREKIAEKDRLFPGALNLTGLDRIGTFQEFDDRFTAPLHGFRDALDYWRQSSCRQFLTAIRHPACIINARNDPFLGPACFPEEEARENRHLTLLMPDTGGHVGFVSRSGEYWSERTTMRFFRECAQ